MFHCDDCDFVYTLSVSMIVVMLIYKLGILESLGLLWIIGAIFLMGVRYESFGKYLYLKRIWRKIFWCENFFSFCCFCRYLNFKSPLKHSKPSIKWKLQVSLNRFNNALKYTTLCNFSHISQWTVYAERKKSSVNLLFIRIFLLHSLRNSLRKKIRLRQWIFRSSFYLLQFFILLLFLFSLWRHFKIIIMKKEKKRLCKRLYNGRKKRLAKAHFFYIYIFCFLHVEKWSDILQFLLFGLLLLFYCVWKKRKWKFLHVTMNDVA